MATDRGRIYIVFGPPDEIEAHPSGGTYDRPMEEGGGETSTYPFERWRYRYIEGLDTSNKQEVWIEFVDTCMCGDYHMTMDPNEKDALLHVPGAGLTQYEQMGLASKSRPHQRIRHRAPGPAFGSAEYADLRAAGAVGRSAAGAEDQVQGPGRGRQPQDQRQPDALRRAGPTS